MKKNKTPGMKASCKPSTLLRRRRLPEVLSLSLLLLLVAALTAGCGRKYMFNEADSHVAKMTPEQKIGQLLMFALPGGGYGKKSDTLMKKYLPGGIILFGYNGNDGGKIKKLVSAYQKASVKYTGIPLFVSTDQEGGKVKRIVKGVTQFPGNMAAGAVGDEELVYDWGRILGIELRRAGINMNLAPVLDVNNNPENPVINTRSFGSDVDRVSDLGTAYIQGIQTSRCIAVAKHFPGHGDTDKDSHLTLPVIRFDMERLRSIELAPFRKAISNDVECIMTAHIAYPNILGNMDSATESHKILTELLRKEMGFRGIIMTDDLEMHAIAKRVPIGEAALRSFLAGTDIILISSHGKNVEDIHKTFVEAYRKGTLSKERLNRSVRRILEMKMRYGIMKTGVKKSEGRKYIFSRDEVLLLEEAPKINRKITSRSIRYAGNEEDIFPREKVKRLFIMEEYALKKRIKRGGNNTFLPSLEALASFKKGEEKTVAYFGFYRPDRAKIDRFMKTCEEKGIRPVMVSTANPFPALLGMGKGTVLMSFSNTKESLKYLAACLNGTHRPGALDHIRFRKKDSGDE